MMYSARHCSVLLALIGLLVGLKAEPLRGQDSAKSPATDEARIRRRLAEWVRQTQAGARLEAAEIWAPDLIGWYPG
jgi:hypothetical protein